MPSFAFSALASASEFIQLSTFDWLSVLFIGGILIAITAYLIKYIINGFKADMEEKMKNECFERSKADTNLANMLKEVSATLGKLTDNNYREHNTFITREESLKLRQESIEMINNLNKRIDNLVLDFSKISHDHRC